MIGVLTLSISALTASWEPAKGPLKTRWTTQVAPDKALPEYPRPQMMRDKWLNLNGLWDYAIVAKEAGKPVQWDGKILVPYPVESALSGVMKTVGESNCLWYRRSIKIPDQWKDSAIILNFGAIDWEATVWVNGIEMGNHKGGYDSFQMNLPTSVKAGAEVEIIVAVWDPSDAGYQARGKQVRRPNGIWYTPVTGIWQTVWLEPVPLSHIRKIKITPNIDNNNVTVRADIAGDNSAVDINVELIQQGRSIAKKSGSPGTDILIPVNNPRLWSPEDPFLYDLKITYAEDQVTSYCGMRKIHLGKDDRGIQRLMLNNKPVFQFGPLDQGFWPDGIYTAPTDEALRYDIEMTRKLGFNMARKHVKVEPERWYYWCDKLGLLVWQDMPSGNFGGRDDKRLSDQASAQYETELKRLVEGFYNHPCIVMWVPFNEGWGQHETARYVNLVKQWDPSRLVNNASGWTDRKVGDVNDIHSYPGPAVPPLEQFRAVVLGEFGGLGMPVKGHTWQDEKNWGYRSFTSATELTDAYLGLIKKLHPMTGDQGLCAAVYTQTTDVEIEVNGLMTYDREMVKMDQSLITKANLSVYTPPTPRRAQGSQLIPPATPLVTHDPYFSIWSPADSLYDEDTEHWTGKPHRMTGMVKVDGKTYRIMGASPSSIPPLKQTSLIVLPTRTLYTFEGAGISLGLEFLTPAIPSDIDILSRPVTYITYNFRSIDGQNHKVAVYFEAASELAVNQANQEVTWETSLLPSSPNNPALRVAKIGSKDQSVLAKRGDDIRIDWGYLYAATLQNASDVCLISSSSAARKAFISGDSIPEDNQRPRAASNETPAAVVTISLEIGAHEAASRWLMLAYDDIYSIQYMRKNLRPYWRRNGWEAADLLKAAAKDYSSLQQRCVEFDKELMTDLMRAGGEKYAKLAALAFRQCFAAGKFVADENGQPISFCKENHSNGCIATSDVFYPMAPQFLLFGPSLAKSFLVPFMNYAASDRWKFPFAPHDLGQYPHANGQVYGGGERTEENQMPVEESGNLLILMAAVAQMEGNINFALKYWPQLEKWADYLKTKGFDPENQLCTDDFAGHLAHNVNLSVKAICGIGAFGKLCEMKGEKSKAADYLKLAAEYAKRWTQEAEDGEKYRLAFDKPGTWSQKYNLVWDRILGLNLFPPSVARKEMDYYKRIQNKYGLPLDNRETYTKLDWILWTATLTQDRADFEALVDPVFLFLNETQDRSPMTDWYFTKSAKKRGFTARPVVGGVFIQMLYDKNIWNKWSQRDSTRAANFAPMPKAPIFLSVLPTADDQPSTWRYTTQKPSADWNKVDFNDSSWKQGKSGFGTQGTPGSVVRTVWNSPNIWLRREFSLPQEKWDHVFLKIHHDEDVEVYLNGVLATSANGYTTDYEVFPLSTSSRETLKSGKNIIAVHCRQTSGGQYIDVGFCEQK